MVFFPVTQTAQPSFTHSPVLIYDICLCTTSFLISTHNFIDFPDCPCYFEKVVMASWKHLPNGVLYLAMPIKYLDANNKKGFGWGSLGYFLEAHIFQIWKAVYTFPTTSWKHLPNKVLYMAMPTKYLGANSKKRIWSGIIGIFNRFQFLGSRHFPKLEGCL